MRPRLKDSLCYHVSRRFVDVIYARDDAQRDQLLASEFKNKRETVESLVEALMGRAPELRFRFIAENLEFAVHDLDV